MLIEHVQPISRHRTTAINSSLSPHVSVFVRRFPSYSSGQHLVRLPLDSPRRIARQQFFDLLAIGEIEITGD